MFTNRFCNFTAFPKTGCEDPEVTICVENRCVCKDDSYHIIQGRFCVEQHCPHGEFYDRNKQSCVRQSKASLDVTENHCRYDYHCYGAHVTCKQYGWNFNCVCDPGFRYDTLTETCLPKPGIGGHCIRDYDCDETTLRKMKCEYTTINDGNKANQQQSQSQQKQKQTSDGTCQCIEGYRYNYNIDGCEALADIAKREHNMRTLVLLFVAFGLMFGLVLSCNFNFFGRGTQPHEMLLQRIKAQERIRRLQQERLEKTKTNMNTTLNMVDYGNQQPKTKSENDYEKMTDSQRNEKFPSDKAIADPSLISLI